jgi:murein DD-endopeptidase MepM/ murein hydrolase activator NlpD
METSMKLAPLALAGLIGACAPASDSNAQSAKAPPPAAGVPAPGLLLSFPIDCEIGKTCEVQNHVDRDPGPDAKDYRCGTQTYQDHGGIDIRLRDMAAQRAGVNVLAAAPGTVSRLRDGVADISVKTNGAALVAGQECGNGVVVDHGGGWETQYCHLAKGSVLVKAGDVVAAGQPIARVGLSGNTEYPHLHLTVRKAGAVVDSFAPNLAPGTCTAGGAGDGLWTRQAAKAMAYKQGVVLNAGFAAAPVSMETIEAGEIAAPTAASPMLIAYVRAINLQGGDVQELTIEGPDGTVLTKGAQPPLDRAKAQYMAFVGKRSPQAGNSAWPGGEYTAAYTVRRDGRPVMTQTFALQF